MKIFLALFLAAVAGVVGWYFYSPTPIVQQFQAAVATGNPKAVEPFMDVPALKSNVAKFLKERYNHEGAPSPLSDEQIQQMVDDFVTPDNILLMMKGHKLEPGNSAAPFNDQTPHPVLPHYESPDVYAVDVYLSQVQTPDNKMSLFFGRKGWFDWKLQGYRFSWS